MSEKWENGRGVLRPAVSPDTVFADMSGYDPVSATGQVAGVANMISFATEHGSVYGCKRSPSLKLV
jgi:altronate hydrolase